MNPVALVHLVAAGIGIAVSRPLIRGRVKRNLWYGIRVPAAFASEERWLELNRYGGRLFLNWSLGLGGLAVCGLLLPRTWWAAYNLLALVPILGGLALVMALIHRQAKSSATLDS
jgi:peptidoglycan/LPS O-acetylase OafA/YrhL